MWSLFSSRLAADVGGVGAPQAPPEVRAAGRSVKAYHAERQAAPASEEVKTQAADDLVTLSGNKDLTSDEVKQVKAILAKVEQGEPLKEADVRQLTLIVSQLETRLRGDKAETPPELVASKAHFETGAAAYDKKDFATAETEFRQAIADCPSDRPDKLSNLYFSLGQTLRQQGKSGEAIAAYQQSIDLNPQGRRDADSKGFIRELGGVPQTAPPEQRQAEHHFELGRAFYEAKHYALAEVEFRAAIGAIPATETKILADLHFNLAKALEEQGKKGEAIDEYNAYLHANPAAADAADIKKQIETLGGEVVPLGTDSAEAQRHYDTAQTLYNGKDYAGAEQSFMKAIAFAPSGDAGMQSDLQHNLGKALEKQGKKAEALEAYKAALALKPDDAELKQQVQALDKELNPPPKSQVQQMMEAEARVLKEGNADNILAVSTAMTQMARDSTDPFELFDLSGSRFTSVAEAVAANPHTDGMTLNAMIESKSQSRTDRMELNAIKNPNIMTRDLKYLAAHGMTEQVRAAAATALQAR